MITDIEKYKNYSHFNSLLKEFDDLGLKIGEYAIFGSGPLAIRGLVLAHDIDVIVKKKCWRFGEIPKNTKTFGNFELSVDWPGFNVDKLIDTSELIEGRSYVKIKYVLKYKRKMNRQKDRETLKDLDL